MLAHAKRFRPDVLTKTSLMLGLGETDEEIAATMDDMRAAGVDILTLGQYLRPTPNHLAIERWVTPEEFERYREWALAKGFLECVSGPLVRSSYRAERALERNNAGLEAGSLAASAWLPSHRPLIAVQPLLAGWSRRLRADLARDAGLHGRSATAETPDEIWFLEHPPVFTLGMNAAPEHVLAPGDIPVVQIDRGGQVTYHGPGQLVVYPLLDVRRAGIGVRQLVMALENAIIALLASWNIAARRHGAMRRASTSTAASSPASGCGSAAAAVIMASRSTSRWIWSRFAASILAVIRGLEVTDLRTLGVAQELRKWPTRLSPQLLCVARHARRRSAGS